MSLISVNETSERTKRTGTMARRRRARYRPNVRHRRWSRTDEAEFPAP